MRFAPRIEVAPAGEFAGKLLDQRIHRVQLPWSAGYSPALARSIFHRSRKTYFSVVFRGGYPNDVLRTERFGRRLNRPLAVVRTRQLLILSPPQNAAKILSPNGRDTQTLQIFCQADSQGETHSSGFDRIEVFLEYCNLGRRSHLPGLPRQQSKQYKQEASSSHAPSSYSLLMQ